MDYMAKEYHCKRCDYHTIKKNSWSLHIKTNKHLRDGRKKRWSCEICNYSSKCRQNFYAHNKSKKHIEMARITEHYKELKEAQEKHKQWKKFEGMKRKLENLEMVEKIRQLEEKLKLKEETEDILKKQLNKAEAVRDNLEQTLMDNNKSVTTTLKTAVENNKSVTTTLKTAVEKAGNTIKNTNCGNKTINVNVFLKEKCKDAMNLEDFVNELTVSMDDVKYAIDNGGDEAISRLLIKNLKDLDPTDRPIHCSDERRSKFYIIGSQKLPTQQNQH